LLENSVTGCGYVPGAAGGVCCPWVKIQTRRFRRAAPGCRRCGRFRPCRYQMTMGRLSASVRVAAALAFKDRGADGMSAFSAVLRWHGAAPVKIGFRSLPSSGLPATPVNFSSHPDGGFFFGVKNQCLAKEDQIVVHQRPWQRVL